MFARAIEEYWGILNGPEDAYKRVHSDEYYKSILSLMQKTEYRGTDSILSEMPKFLVEIRKAFSGSYLSMK